MKFEHYMMCKGLVWDFEIEHALESEDMQTFGNMYIYVLSGANNSRKKFLMI
jgi:hypothetical protein